MFLVSSRIGFSHRMEKFHYSLHKFWSEKSFFCFFCLTVFDFVFSAVSVYCGTIFYEHRGAGDCMGEKGHIVFQTSKVGSHFFYKSQRQRHAISVLRGQTMLLDRSCSKWNYIIVITIKWLGNLAVFFVLCFCFLFPYCCMTWPCTDYKRLWDVNEQMANGLTSHHI